MVETPHGKYVAPKFETIIQGQGYAISINPLDEYKVSQTPQMWVRRQYDALQQITRGVTMELYPEVSPTGRFHFHGYITINDKWEYVKTLHGLAVYGTYCIKPIQLTASGEDVDWKAYVTKQSKDWKYLFRTNVMSYPIQIAGAIR